MLSYWEPRLIQNFATALQIRAGQQSITANLSPFVTHIYHVMIIVTGSFSRESFLTNIIGFPKIHLNDHVLVSLEFKLIY